MELESESDTAAWRTTFRAAGTVLSDELKKRHLMCVTCREQSTAGTDHPDGRLQALREIIDIKKWEINGDCGRYIRLHEAVQHISIRDRLDEFMQQHGDTLASISPRS